ncbi:MAG: hypothetical protein Ct9H90mP22_5260 [Gammaproteobacteria bacterium]|nr:MAG: hypothetical protein Ct9H90mP22_5260 [Gammaproteobacteria bacterium]
MKGYQNIRSHLFAALNLIMREYLYQQVLGDVGQLHVVEKPFGMRKQVTFFDEPFGFPVSVKPNGAIPFTMDSGGSENAQIYVMNPENGRTVLVSEVNLEMVLSCGEGW